MRKVTWLLFGIAITGLVALRVTGPHVQREQTPDSQTTTIEIPLPVSLGNYFPPGAEQPVYLLMMLEMNKPFTGIVVDLSEQDADNARANFKKFRGHYVELSKLVPEWTEYFPMGPLNALQTALETGNQEKVIAAVQQVGKVCSDCHVSVLPQVQHRYFWGNFREIRITDPLTSQDVTHRELMQFMDANFTGIEIDAEQGQLENARSQFQNFRARFQTMEGTCVICHDTERHYYVDESVKTMIDELGRVLTAPSIDPATVSRLSQRIGMESCFKCHLVHMPAAMAQLQGVR